MSIEFVEKEIKRFLNAKEREVICIRGKWGVGKTYVWSKLIREAKEKNEINCSSYIYVSLFGIDSLDQLKNAISENKFMKEFSDFEPTSQISKNKTFAKFKNWVSKSFPTAQKLPLVENYIPAFQSAIFQSIRDTIICFDDMERKGLGLSMNDIMGLTSHLSEQKKCKVVLILNDDALEDDNKGDFGRYSEKVISISLQYEPGASDCARIAIAEGDQNLEQLRTAVIELGISNIRIIKKIERMVVRVSPLINKLHSQVMFQAVRSLALLGWSEYSEDSAPTHDFILHKRKAHVFGQRANAKISENEKNWNMLLDEFGFHIADEFDLELLEGIKSGFFKEDTLQVHANKLHEQFVARDRNNDAEDSLKAAWKLYHNSFDDNGAEVIEAIFDACKKYVNFVTPTNLGGAMMLLKDLNQPEKARELLDYYIEKRSENRDLFDLEDNPFGDDISDPELRAAFVEKYTSFTDTRSPHEVFIRIAKDGIWGRDDMILLSKLSKDDFYSIFKGLKGRDLSRAINRGLKIGDKDDPSEEQRKISVGIKEALTKIARESHINQRRVQQKYGVEIDD